MFGWLSVCMWVNYLGFYPFRHLCIFALISVFVSIIAFSPVWAKLGFKLQFYHILD